MMDLYLSLTSLGYNLDFSYFNSMIFAWNFDGFMSLIYCYISHGSDQSRMSFIVNKLSSFCKTKYSVIIMIIMGA